MRHAVLLALLVSPMLPGAVQAQTEPDISGTWTLSPDAPPGANGKPVPAPGFGASVNIHQNGEAITISRILGGTTVHVRHSLDGSETTARAPGRLCMGESRSVWTAGWEDGVLVTRLTGVIAAGATTLTPSAVSTTFRLESPDTLAVDVSVRSAASAEPRTTSTRYRRTGQPAPPPDVKPAPLEATIAQAAWLGGTWTGTAGTTTTEERWTPSSGGSMMAISRTLRNGTMNAFEFLCIVERGGGLVYQAMPNGRQPATDFVLTKVEENSLTFENPVHDFPKMIRYSLTADGTLEAVVGGAEGQKPLVFRFRRQ
jgi:hypothetical protein